MNLAYNTKRRIEREYVVVNGIIMSPGKYEGECVWVPYYWGLALAGEGEDVLDDTGEILATRFIVDSEEEAAFGLECGSTVEIFEDSQGFVIGTVIGFRQ